MKIIAINGNTPYCGKDTAAKAIADNKWCNRWTQICPIAVELKSHTLRVYNLSLHWSHFEAYKDVPVDQLYGLTPRQAYIAHAEHMKKLHGEDFWLRKAIENIDRVKTNVQELFNSNMIGVIMIPDIGFQFELETLAAYYGKENVGLLQIVNHAVKKVDDSRTLIQPLKESWFTLEIENGHIPLEQYIANVQNAVGTYINDIV